MTATNLKHGAGGWREWWSLNQRKVMPYIFITPTLLIFLVFVAFPILYSAVISFFKWNGISEPVFRGIRNYLRLLDDRVFWISLQNTVNFTIGVVPLSMIIGLLAALGLNRPKLPGRAALRAIYFLPFVISAVATATTAGWIFGDTFGVINKLLVELGMKKVQWLTNRHTAMLTVVFVTVWVRLGFCMLIYLAGLQSIPPDLVEAAKVDGASRWRQFRHITLPLLKPTTFLLIVLNIIYSFEVFDMVFVLTNGGPGYATTVLTVFIYNSAFQTQSVGYASAIGIVFMAIIMTITLVQWRLSNEGGRIN